MRKLIAVFWLAGTLWAGGDTGKSGSDCLAQLENELLTNYIELTEMHPDHARKHLQETIRNLHAKIDELKTKLADEKRWEKERIALDLSLEEIERIGNEPFSLENLQLMRDSVLLLDALATSSAIPDEEYRKLSSSR